MNFTELVALASEKVKIFHYEEALKLYKKALLFEPNHQKIYFNLGVLYLYLEEFYNAIEHFKKALKLDKNYISAHTNLAISLKKIKEYPKAIYHLKIALELSKEEDVDILYNLGNTLSLVDAYEEAHRCFDRVISLKPEYYKAYHGKGLVYNSMMEYEKAYSYFQKTLAFKKDYSDSLFAMSLIELRNGDYLEGWKHYESRFEATNPLKKLSYEVPFYKGEELKNKTILIQEEQGFGDNIQFIRYIKRIVEENPKKIYVAVRKELLRVFKLIPDIEVVTNEAVLYDVDFVVSLLSLPHIFKTTPQNIPKDIPYLKVENDNDVSQKIIQKSSKFKVGFAYQGNKEHKNDSYRSIPLEIFKTLFELTHIEFYSLQIGENKDLEKIKKGYQNLFDCNDVVGDFYDSGQIISKLDLIITIDSALGHFSGAMGKKTFLLLPKNSEWRWLEKIDYSPWYPTMRLFRQKELGIWGDVIDEVFEVLNKL